VHDTAAFDHAVRSMVIHDVRRCWHANGRPTLSQPTGPVYEILRQVGVHPVKGSGAGKGRADLMRHREYVFSQERMKRNCGRLSVGAIGSLRGGRDSRDGSAARPAASLSSP